MPPHAACAVHACAKLRLYVCFSARLYIQVRDFEDSVRKRADRIVHKYLDPGSINELNVLVRGHVWLERAAVVACLTNQNGHLPQGTIKTKTKACIRSGNFEVWDSSRAHSSMHACTRPTCT